MKTCLSSQKLLPPPPLPQDAILLEGHLFYGIKSNHPRRIRDSLPHGQAIHPSIPSNHRWPSNSFEFRHCLVVWSYTSTLGGCGDLPSIIIIIIIGFADHRVLLHEQASKQASKETSSIRSFPSDEGLFRRAERYCTVNGNAWWAASVSRESVL